MISYKDDDDDDEEEEDLFVQPLTKEFTAESLDEEYYNLVLNEKKPTMAIRFDWEDQRRRCYLSNIMEKYKMKLVSSLNTNNFATQVYYTLQHEFLFNFKISRKGWCNGL